MRLLSSVSLPGVISGIAGNSSGTTIITVDALEGKIHSFIVGNRVLERAASTQFRVEGYWSRRPFPFVVLNDYFRTNSFDCAVTPTGDVMAVTTPSIPLTLLSLPELKVIGQFGGVGEARNVCWTEDSRRLLITRLVGRLEPPTDLQWETIIVDFNSGSSEATSRWLIGRTILANRLSAMITMNDIQGGTEVYVHEATAPHRPYDIVATCYVRPDGIVLDTSQEHVAVVELDYSHRLSVINLRTWTQRLFSRYAGETTRPDHAHNLSILGFDPYETAVYTPGPAGSIYRIAIKDGESRTFISGHTDVTGIILVQDQGLLISAGSEGVLHLWEVEPPSTIQRAGSSGSELLAVDLNLARDSFTKIVEFDD